MITQLRPIKEKDRELVLQHVSFKSVNFPKCSHISEKKKVSCFKDNSQDAKALKSYILEFLFKLIKSKKQNPKLLLFQEESRNIPKENARLHSYSMKI